MSQWTIKSTSTAGDEGTRSLDKYLEEGWEPFAVVKDAQGIDHVYLRRWTKVRKDDRTAE